MNIANPKVKVTKTDVARYLCDHSELFPVLIPLRVHYIDKCSRARRIDVAQFGFWIRTNKPKLFERIYKKLLRDPDLLGKIYAEDANA
jgi:hypothetical protein